MFADEIPLNMFFNNLASGFLWCCIGNIIEIREAEFTKVLLKHFIDVSDLHCKTILAYKHLQRRLGRLMCLKHYTDAGPYTVNEIINIVSSTKTDATGNPPVVFSTGIFTIRLEPQTLHDYNTWRVIKAFCERLKDPTLPDGFSNDILVTAHDLHLAETQDDATATTYLIKGGTPGSIDCCERVIARISHHSA